MLWHGHPPRYRQRCKGRSALVRRQQCSVLLSREIIDKLNKEINAGLADPRIKARLADLGNIGLAVSPADFGNLIADETEKWSKVVKFSGAKPD
jgi:hypothetical protein